MKGAGLKTWLGRWSLALGWLLPFVSTYLVLISLAAESMAVASPRLYVPPIPENLESVDLYLLTAGVGDEIANRFGHTGIRIQDRNAGSDVVFNWGKFHFDDPGFAWKFFRGSLVYSMGVRTFQNDTSVYEESGRRLVMDRLNLTPSQKRQLIEKIRWNAQPENREFAYQYWYKNCATIPRDYLNEVLHGQIITRFASRPAGRVFRDYVRRNLAYVPFIVPLLDTLMNGNIDRGISLWEDMFLPSRLREVLLEMPAVDDHGRLKEGERLLVEERILVDKEEPFASPLPDYAVLAFPAWLSLIVFGGCMAARGLGFFTPTTVARDLWKTLALRALGCGTTYWGILSGIVGATLALNWAFSGHPDGWANTNLLFIWPTDLCLIPLGWQLMMSGTTVKDRWPWPGAGKLYAALKSFGILILVLGYKFHMIDQDVSRVVLAFGLPALGLLWADGLWGLTTKTVAHDRRGAEHRAAQSVVRTSKAGKS
jgi:hypothetical protein